MDNVRFDMVEVKKEVEENLDEDNSFVCVGIVNDEELHIKKENSGEGSIDTFGCSSNDGSLNKKEMKDEMEFEEEFISTNMEAEVCLKESDDTLEFDNSSHFGHGDSDQDIVLMKRKRESDVTHPRDGKLYKTMGKQVEKEVTLEFISIYRNHECLWKVQSKDYCNKNKRNGALEDLLTIYRKLVPEATKADALRKINTLRSCFRRENKRVIDSKKSGSGTDGLYTSSLYYFDALKFLTDQDVPRQSTGTLKGDENLGDTTNLGSLDIGSGSPEVVDVLTSPQSTTSVKTPIWLKRPRPPKKKDPTQKIIVSDNLNRRESSMTIFGKYVGLKLNEFAPTTTRIARRLINEVIDAAEVGELNSTSCLIFNNQTFQNSNGVRYVPNQLTSSDNILQAPQNLNSSHTSQNLGQTFVAEVPLNSNSGHATSDKRSYLSNFTPL